MAFGPALSLGVASLCEVLDVKIGAEMDPAAILAALSEGAAVAAPADFAGGVLVWLLQLSAVVLIFAKQSAPYYRHGSKPAQRLTA